MTLELNRLTQTVQEMGRALADQARDLGARVEQARAWLAEFAEPEPALRDAAAKARVAIPAGEPLNSTFPLPEMPQRFTAIGADGSQIEPDRHGLAFYYLINVGGLVYRHGSGETPEASSVPDLRYDEQDLYEGSRPVQGNLLDVRRDQAELTHLAELVSGEADGPVLALVDGTLLLWVLENEPVARKAAKIEAYMAEMERIRHKGAALAAFTSRPRSADVTRFLHLAQAGGDVRRAETEPNPIERVPDRVVFADLPPGARSARFVASSDVNVEYGQQGHEISFFYVNVAGESEDPAIARVEVPAWVSGDPSLLALAHGGVVAQSRIVGGFPYVLARADELSFISGPERERLGEMVGTALLAAGLWADVSPKAAYKAMTRTRRRRR